MRRVIDSRSPQPIRLQVRSLLLEDLQRGVYRPNQRIPSERRLAEYYRASRTSVREAIADLIRDGLLFRAAGRGTFACERPADPAPAAVTLKHIGFWISEEIFHFVEAGYSRILTGAEEACRARGYSLGFRSVNPERQSTTELLDAGLEHAGFAGHIVAGGLHRTLLGRLKELGAPLVIVDPLLRRQIGDIDCVRIDYAQGMRAAVQHLYDLGHRSIGFIGFPNSEKYDAFWHALEEHGLRYHPRFVEFLEMPDLAPSILVGYQCMARLLANQDRPSALVAANDFIALGALEALSIAGLAVPGELSIVGCDNIARSTVPLTTVDCDLMETGRLAAATLLDRLEDPDRPARLVTIPVEMVIRGSTAAPHQTNFKPN